MIDICDFAVGLSRQLYGLTHRHRARRPPHDGNLASAGRVRRDLGLQLPRGRVVVERGARAGLRRLGGVEAVREDPAHGAGRACDRERAIEALRRCARRPAPSLLLGRRDIGEVLVDDHRVPILSATGSTAMGRQVGPKLAARFARAILELGGNNAAIVTPSADLDLTLRGIAFAAMGTAGQRCTTLRRLFVHDSVYDSSCPSSRRSTAACKSAIRARPARWSAR
jgi:aldehyde dehydrogenase (NAD+)